MIRACTWAVVCSTTRARIIFDLDRDGSAETAEVVMRAQEARLRSLLFGDGKAARLPAAAVARCKWEDRRAFARDVVDAIAGCAEAWRIGALAVAAPSSILPLLLPEIGQALGPPVVWVIEGDLTRLTLEEIRHRFCLCARLA